MATCKDCIHCEACERMISDSNEMFKVLLSEILETNCDIKHGSTYTLSGAEFCQCFQDRSRFVELPCKLGDFVYYIKARRVMADIVSKFTIDRCGIMLQRVNGYNLGYTDQLGKKIFLTREEAEQALKEREENDKQKRPDR